MAFVPVATPPNSPPYLPFARFVRSLDRLAAYMPPRVDRSFWSDESPYNAAVLISAYAFLGLVDANSAPTSLLRRLAGDIAARPQTLAEVLRRAYGEVVEAVSRDEALEQSDTLLAAFRISGNTHRKAVSFLLQACRYAGIPVSSKLAARLRLTHEKSRPMDVARAGESTSITVRLSSGGELTLTGRFDPFTLSAADRRFVYKLVDELSAYGKRAAPEQEVEQEDEVPF